MGLYVFYNKVINCEVISKGSSVGGLAGQLAQNKAHAPRSSYIENTKVEGTSKVGGIVGEMRDGELNGNISKTEVKATSHSAGGLIGYLDNTNMTTASMQSLIKNNGVAGSKITAPTKVGGLIGDISKDLIKDTDFYQNNYVHAYLSSDDKNVSMGIGGSNRNNDVLENTYVYKYSQINGEYMNEDIDTYDEEQYIEGEDLKQEDTYKNIFGWGTRFTYTSLQNDKYPIPNGVTGVEGIDLPTDPEIVDLNAINTEDENNTITTESNSNDMLTQSIEALPEVTVYPISVNEINVDFSNITEGISFTYYINSVENETIDLTDKTYTFKYNFDDELKFVIKNGIDEKTITINPSEIRSEISLIGDNHAYLIGNNLYTNGELQEGKYVNIYDGYALNTSGQVIDITSGQVVENNFVETSLEETTKPLHIYEYRDCIIEVYGTYSKVNGNIKQQIYNVRSGILSALSNSINMKIDNYIVDSYNDKEYQTILTNSGEIVDLKEQLQYPDNFLSRNVKQIVQNSNADNTEMMVIYNTGKVIVFNYVNGSVIYETEEKADSGLTDYITGSINSIWSDYESKQSEYARSKALIARLAEMPIEEVLEDKESSESNTNFNNSIESINNANIGNINNTDLNTLTTTSNEESYITVYNGETGEYEVYSESEILEGSEEIPVSETEKIKANGLERIYNYEKEEEAGIQLNGAIIVVVIIIIAIISLIILRKLVYKNNQNNTKK